MKRGGFIFQAKSRRDSVHHHDENPPTLCSMRRDAAVNRELDGTTQTACLELQLRLSVQLVFHAALINVVPKPLAGEFSNRGPSVSMLPGK